MTDSEIYKLIKNTEYINTTGDLDYQIIHKDGLCFLLFQESRTKQDWKVNFDFPCKLYRHGKIWCHRGYGNTYKKAKDEIMKKFITELSDAEKPIICGWSYGASLAVLAAEDFNYRTGIKADCITFGGAKIFYTFRTVRYLRKCMNVTEYEQPNDFVTWVNPFCHKVNKKVVGEKFTFRKILNTAFYHCNYDLVV